MRADLQEAAQDAGLILVGHDGHGRDALVLGRVLASALEAPLVHANPDYLEDVRASIEDRLAGVAAPIRDEVGSGP